MLFIDFWASLILAGCFNNRVSVSVSCLAMSLCPNVRSLSLTIRVFFFQPVLCLRVAVPAVLSFLPGVVPLRAAVQFRAAVLCL